MTPVPLERLSGGRRLRALWNWPAMMPHVRSGFVKREHVRGTRWAVFELTEKGKRKVMGYHMQAAGYGR